MEISRDGLLFAHEDHEPIKITSRIKIRNGGFRERHISDIGLLWASPPVS